MMQAVPFALAAPRARGRARAAAHGREQGGARPRISTVERCAAEHLLDAPPTTECVLVDRTSFDAAPPPPPRARFRLLFYGVAISNDVSARPGARASTLLGPTGRDTSASRSRTSRAGSSL